MFTITPSRRLLPALLATATLALTAPGVAHAAGSPDHHGPHPAGRHAQGAPTFLRPTSASGRGDPHTAAVGMT